MCGVGVLNLAQSLQLERRGVVELRGVEGLSLPSISRKGRRSQGNVQAARKNVV
jgi:hypothetical protein